MGPNRKSSVAGGGGGKQVRVISLALLIYFVLDVAT